MSDTIETETSAVVLRAAANKLREMAKGTTSGPWLIIDTDTWPRLMISTGQSEEGDPYRAAEVAKSSRDGDDDGLDVSDADWAWMAFASPALAEPLAMLFDHFAAKYEHLAKLFPDGGNGPAERLAEGGPWLHVDFALAVARVINGGDRA